MKTVRHADHCAGHWSEPEPEFTPAQEDIIDARAAELFEDKKAEYTEDDWMDLGQDDKQAIYRQCRKAARTELNRQIVAAREEQEIYDHEANHE